MKKFSIAIILFCCIMGMTLSCSQDPGIKTVKIELTKDGSLYVQGKLSSYNLLAGSLEKEINTLSPSEEINDCVIIKAHESIKMEDLEKVKKALRQVQFNKINYSTSVD